MPILKDRFLTFDTDTNRKILVEAISTSSGTADANSIPKTGADGKLPLSLMPSEVTDLVGGAEVVRPASSGLTAGMILNVYRDSTDGLYKVQPADAASGRPANAYVKSDVAAGGDATISMTPGEISNLTLPTDAQGYVYLGTSGAITQSPSYLPAEVRFIQVVGFVISADAVQFKPDVPDWFPTP